MLATRRGVDLVSIRSGKASGALVNGEPGAFPRTIEGCAEATRREEKRAAAEATRREEKRAAAEATRREEKRAAAAAAAKDIETDRLAAAAATSRDQTLMDLETRVMEEIDREALALAKRHPGADAQLWVAVRTELEAHPVTLEIAGAPRAVRELPHYFAADIVAEAGQQSPRPSRRTPPPRPEVIAETVEDVRDRVQSVIREMAAEQGIELPAAVLEEGLELPAAAVSDTPSVTDTPTPPGAQGAEVKRPSAVDGMPGGAAQPKRDRTGGKER